MTPLSLLWISRVSSAVLMVDGYVLSECRKSTGTHSLERSFQEDTLLVLFNTAISNLVRERTSSICGHPRLLNTFWRSCSVTTSL